MEALDLKVKREDYTREDWVGLIGKDSIPIPTHRWYRREIVSWGHSLIYPISAATFTLEVFFFCDCIL